MKARFPQFFAPAHPRCLRTALVLTLLLGTGVAARAHGDLELRIRDLTRQIQAATNNPARLYLARAELQREHQSWTEAAADYSRAAAADPALPNLGYSQARMLFESGRLPEALTLVEAVLAKGRDDGRARLLRGQIHARNGDRAQAIEDYRAGLDKLPGPDPAVFLEWAALETAEKRDPAAVECLDRGLQRVGPEVSLLTRAWELEVELQRYEAALGRLDALLELANRREGWLVKRGELLAKMDRKADARQSYEAALATIAKLPPRLQQSPSMVKLRAEIDRGLAGL